MFLTSCSSVWRIYRSCNICTMPGSPTPCYLHFWITTPLLCLVPHLTIITLACNKTWYYIVFEIIYLQYRGPKKYSMKGMLLRSSLETSWEDLKLDERLPSFTFLLRTLEEGFSVIPVSPAPSALTKGKDFSYKFSPKICNHLEWFSYFEVVTHSFQNAFDS